MTNFKYSFPWVFVKCWIVINLKSSKWCFKTFVSNCKSWTKQLQESNQIKSHSHSCTHANSQNQSKWWNLGSFVKEKQKKKKKIKKENLAHMLNGRLANLTLKLHDSLMISSACKFQSVSNRLIFGKTVSTWKFPKKFLWNFKKKTNLLTQLIIKKIFGARINFWDLGSFDFVRSWFMC